MTTFVDIRTALIKAVKDAGKFGIQFNHENIGSKPVVGIPHANTYVMPSDSNQVVLGANGKDQHDGIFQISLFYPKNKGDLPGLKKADEIAAVFKSGAAFTHNGVTVNIQSIQKQPARNDGSWHQFDLLIYWYSFIGRV